MTNSYAMQARSASSLNVLLGCWLIASPWIFGYTAGPSGFWNSICAGVLIAVLAISRVSAIRTGSGRSWVNFLLGLWMIVSPWIYGYFGNASATWDNVALGIVVAALAAWSSRASEVDDSHRVPPTASAAH